MKTSGYYFMYLFKVIAFIVFILWLCSACNGRHAKIKLIHDYQDSIGIAKLNVRLIDDSINQLSTLFAQIYPAKTFPNTRVGAHARALYHDSAQIAYKKYMELYRRKNAIWDSVIQIHLTNEDRYKRIVDSLKLILQ